MSVHEKIKKFTTPKPYRSSREVVAEWRSRAKYPEWGREEEYLRVFKYADGMGDVFVRDGDTGEIRLTYGGTKGLPFDDEIAWAVNSDFIVTPVPPEEFHTPEEVLIASHFVMESKDPATPAHLQVFVYTNGMGALEMGLATDDDHVPLCDMVPLEGLEGYFDEDKWEVKRVV